MDSTILEINILKQEYILRFAKLGDCKRIFEIRNKPQIRQTCLNTEAISYSNHERWYKATLESQNRHLLVLEISKIIIGVVRFDINALQAYISIYLDTDYQNKGFGTFIYRQSEIWLKITYKNLKRIVADIIESNIRSKCFFTKMGFVQNDINIWEKIIINSE